MADRDGQSGDVNTGISRRTLLRRGAVVGGALVWATPIVQSIPHPAYAAGSHPPTEHPTAITHVAAVVTCHGGAVARARYDVASGAWQSHPAIAPVGQDGICLPAGWGAAGTVPIDGGDAGLEVTVDADDPSSATVTVPGTVLIPAGGGALHPTDCTVVGVAATASGGGDCATGSDGQAPFAVRLQI